MAGARPRRYAEALFELAKERGTLDEWRHDLRAAVDQLGSEQVLHQLSNPELHYDQVREALQRVLGGRVAGEVLNLLLLLVRRQQLLLLPQVADRYDELVDRERRVEKATVRTAVPLAALELEALLRKA
jgi:F-type H+-transporting ATPase subunit delta